MRLKNQHLSRWANHSEEFSLRNINTSCCQTRPASYLNSNGHIELRLQERMLRSQNQNAKNTPKRTETKLNEEFLSSIVIKTLPLVILCPFPSIRARSRRTD